MSSNKKRLIVVNKNTKEILYVGKVDTLYEANGKDKAIYYNDDFYTDNPLGDYNTYDEDIIYYEDSHRPSNPDRNSDPANGQYEEGSSQENDSSGCCLGTLAKIILIIVLISIIIQIIN